MNRCCAEDELQLSLSRQVPLLFFGERVDQPLHHVIGRLVVWDVVVTLTLLQEGLEDLLGHLDILANLSKLGDEELANRSSPFREKLKLHASGEYVDGKVGGSVQPLFLSAEDRPDKGAAAESGNGADAQGLPLDRGPVFAGGELGCQDVFQLFS